jgi:hypothetical protein
MRGGMMDRVLELLKEIIHETSRFDSLYDRTIRDKALEALTILAASGRRYSAESDEAHPE